MVFAFAVRHQVGGSVAMNLSLLVVCLSVGALVHHGAPAVHALRGWRKVAAVAGANVVGIIVLMVAMLPALVQAQLSFFMECICYWGWESWCCYF